MRRMRVNVNIFRGCLHEGHEGHIISSYKRTYTCNLEMYHCYPFAISSVVYVQETIDLSYLSLQCGLGLDLVTPDAIFYKMFEHSVSHRKISVCRFFLERTVVDMDRYSGYLLRMSASRGFDEITRLLVFAGADARLAIQNSNCPEDRQAILFHVRSMERAKRMGNLFNF